MLHMWGDMIKKFMLSSATTISKKHYIDHKYQLIKVNYVIKNKYITIFILKNID